MSEEQRASLEARTRAELAMKNLTDGEVHVHCAPPIGVVEYSAHGIPIRSNSTTLAADSRQWIEEFLALIPGLLASATDSERRADASEALRVEPTPTDIAPRPPEQQKTPSIAQASQIPEASPRHHQAYAPDLGIGACLEVWAKPVNALLGPCATLGLRLSSLSRMALIVGAQWGATRPTDMAIRHWHAGTEARFGRAIWLALGAHLSVLNLTPTNNLLPDSQYTYEPMFTLNGGLSTTLAGHRFVTSAGVRSYPEYRDVRVNGQSVFRLPMFALTLAVEYEFDL